MESLADGHGTVRFQYKQDQYTGLELHRLCATESPNAKVLRQVQEILDSPRGANDLHSWAVQDTRDKEPQKVQAIHVATYYGHAQLVQLLLKAGAWPSVQEAHGQQNSPLHIAAWYDRQEVGEVLLLNGADPSIKTKGRPPFTPLHFAARLGKARMVEDILKAVRQRAKMSQDWTATSFSDDRPAIQLACEADSVESFTLLLQDMEDNRPLYTCREGKKKCIEKRKDLIKTTFSSRPKIAAALLARVHDMEVARELLLDARNVASADSAKRDGAEEEESVQQILAMLRNSETWAPVLDQLVKTPELMAGSFGKTLYDRQNSINFWKQNFTNWWRGLAHLTADVRTACHTKDVFLYSRHGPQDDRKCKSVLANKLEGARGPTRSQAFVSIGVVPLNVKLLRTDAVIETLAKETKLGLLGTKFVKAVLDDAWRPVQVWYVCHMFWAFLQVVAACLASSELQNGQVSSVAFALLFLGWLKRLLEELWQLRGALCMILCPGRRGSTVPGKSTKSLEESERERSRIYDFVKTHGCSFNTVLDWLYLTIAGSALYFLWFFEPWPPQRSLIAFYFALVWCSALYWLRGVSIGRFNEKLLPILWTMRDTGTFLIVVTFTFAAAVHAYFILSVPRMPASLYRAIEKTFRLGFLGDFDLYELEFVDTIFLPGGNGALEPEDPAPTEDHVFVHAFFYVVAFCLTIVEMNLFIGILSSNYDKHLNQAASLAARERARLIWFMKNSLWTSLWKCCCQRSATQTVPQPDSSGEQQNSGEEWLFAVFRKGEDAAAEAKDELEQMREDLRAKEAELATTRAQLEEARRASQLLSSVVALTSRRPDEESLTNLVKQRRLESSRRRNKAGSSPDLEELR